MIGGTGLWLLVSGRESGMCLINGQHNVTDEMWDLFGRDLCWDLSSLGSNGPHKN
jgi:hypothetical protein